ncbi:hypothetical protein DdX_03917 [Ditylenchus destructor]|uniref:ShKT domain-containing protein n=1 Tax=Ditylenchus destructor TaxID=166010 RepID=A0AAD4RBN7_9BILA|nr:hypothetical protein DdX_03917 [Ditylenchus destructor]
MANCILVMGIILVFTMFKFGQTGPFEQSDENANSVGNDDGDPPAHDGEDGVGEDEKGEDGNGEDSGAEVGGAGGENEDGEGSDNKGEEDEGENGSTGVDERGAGEENDDDGGGNPSLGGSHAQEQSEKEGDEEGQREGGEEEEKDGPKSHGDPDQPIEGDENAHENANSGTEDGPPSEDPNKKISSEQNENHGEHQEEREEGEGHEGDHQEEPQLATKTFYPIYHFCCNPQTLLCSYMGEHDGAHDTLDPGKWPYHHRLRCQRTDGHIEHIATICTNELADEVCEELFPHDHDDAARERRPKKCDLLGVDCLTKKCAKHCKICCELSAYGCGDDPKHKVSCMTQTKHTCEKMKDAMLITCAASCGLCNVGHCRDTMDDCISFREQCHDKAVKKNLRKHCARTCGFCDVHCRDKASKRTCKKLKKVCYKKAEHVRGRKRGKKLRNQARYIKSARKVCKLTCGLCHNQDINHYGSGEESSEE